MTRTPYHTVRFREARVRAMRTARMDAYSADSFPAAWAWMGVDNTYNRTRVEVMGWQRFDRTARRIQGSN